MFAYPLTLDLQDDFLYWNRQTHISVPYPNHNFPIPAATVSPVQDNEWRVRFSKIGIAKI